MLSCSDKTRGSVSVSPQLFALQPVALQEAASLCKHAELSSVRLYHTCIGRLHHRGTSPLVCNTLTILRPAAPAVGPHACLSTTPLQLAHTRYCPAHLIGHKAHALRVRHRHPSRQQVTLEHHTACRLSRSGACRGGGCCRTSGTGGCLQQLQKPVEGGSHGRWRLGARWGWGESSGQEAQPLTNPTNVNSLVLSSLHRPLLGFPVAKPPCSTHTMC